MNGEKIKFVSGRNYTPKPGSAGLRTQCPGMMVSVSNVARATGGIAPGNLVQSDSK